MPEPVTLSTAEVAALLGLSRARFVGWVGRARCDYGFPLKVPHTHRYSRAAVLAWIARNGAPEPPPPAPPAPATPQQDVIAAEDVLLRRAHAMIAAE